MRTLLADATSTVQEGLGVAGDKAGYTTNLELTTIVANIINVILGLTGIAFVGILVYAGILYLTAAGEEANVKKAKKLLSNSVIGIIIIVSAYAIANYVFAALASITS
ncbi:hypothetical protein A2348_02275 [Candidatus Uhrbacteria bacterium RIFOXYB12_FULL_58_10]|uniref:Uncharacterized protein n=1 Tax=Candidatus Uhrbacteria bacterium RIFOXYB2_FULL_57_15 TaxID=1802422 RepID=A0A1F7WB59_9BACT|nr:MAG: hypothetical protein A2348_02275 [Candidatus Uhrbacteria bacterium RIFOXYB12_FULL_58_10]OGL99628.1 MAG: hypothetical protein A2304_04470 [Candidatus Uhrbacteria bacterium RIFOXYB2_FULL_57_15]OGM00451.1 MAG: hypothetical protein A2501_00610 [Candidatus Uhrbacteria bacterium RIFOXYC12_FULL_57_11]